MRRQFSDFVFRSYRKRKAINGTMCALLLLAAILALVPLVSIFAYVVSQGAPALNFAFFTELPKPVGEVGGGMANSLLGTVILVFLGSLVGVPWGIATGVYLSEYGRGFLATVVRFSADMLGAVPSIVIGLFIYEILVVTMKHFSAIAGGAALAVLMVPTVARSSEELLKLVPQNIREAGLALGLPRWKVTLMIVLKGIKGPIVTGVMLSVARVAGETAPLLFTAFNNRFWARGVDQPIASLPVQIYTYAISPYDEWHRQAWAGALMLVCLVFSMNLLTRLVLAKGVRS